MGVDPLDGLRYIQVKENVDKQYYLPSIGLN
jgi:hypothetical protein